MAGNLTAMIAAIFSGSAVSTDPYFNLTTLLLSTTATNGQQNNTFLDSSTNNFTITRNPATGPNAPTQGTFSPFSQTGWSNYFDGTGDYLSTPSSSAFSFGTGDFTIEYWVYVNSGTNNGIFQLSDTAGGLKPSQANSLAMNIFTNNSVSIYANGTSYQAPNNTLPYNSWTHFAIVRSSNVTKLYANGSLVTSIGSSGSITDNTNYTGLYVAVGGYYSTAYLMTGYVSNFRVVKGTAVYTSNFTPPTAPLTAVTNTQLLTCQSNRFVDNSTNNFTITRNGDTTVVPFSPFNPTSAWSASTVGGSGYFDGTGDYLSVAHNAAFNLGSNDWCIEFFVYKLNSTTATLVTKRPNNGVAAYPNIFANTSNQIGIELGGATFTTASSLALNAWTHIAVVKNGSGSANVKCYINGTADANTGTLSSAITSNTNALVLAGDTNGNYMTGYMSNFRMVNGSPVYTTNFTPPTAPLTAITNTSLLLNFTNSGVYDATAKNVLETVGTAQVSTTQSKWSPTSMYFDGTGDYLLIPDNPSQRIGTGNFTVECWVYRNASGTYGLIGKGTGTTGWLLSLNSSNQVVFTYGSSTITSTGTISATTWTHIAVVRSGTGANLTKIYISGTNDGTGTVSTDFNQTNAMYVAADRTGGSNANAYVQDTRVTLYARYTANFTSPTAAFPVQ